MKHSHHYFAAMLAAFLSLQLSTMQSASATKTVKPKGQGHKFGFGWFKKSGSGSGSGSSAGGAVHKNGYPKSYHNPNFVHGHNDNHGQGSPKHDKTP
jgi:hypothetical protein